MAETLPPGWRQFQTADARTYYYNEITNQTTWRLPSTPATAIAFANSPLHMSQPSTAAPTSSNYPPATPPPHSQLVAPLPTAPPGSQQVPYNPVSQHLLQTAQLSRFTMSSLVTRTKESCKGQGLFELENNYLLGINLTASHTFAWIKNGSMVARRGQIKFTRQGMREQGIGKMMKKAITGEGMKLVKAEGTGKVYCAENGKVVSVLEMNNESISINGNDVLALSGSLQYDIKIAKGAGMLSGGLFNVKVWGSGFVAFTCHGAVLTLQATPEDPVYTDPQATVAWTHDPQFKMDVNMKMLIGKSTGEEFQLMFSQGFVMIQPHEELSTTGGSAGGAAGAFTGGLANGLIGI